MSGLSRDANGCDTVTNNTGQGLPSTRDSTNECIKCGRNCVEGNLDHSPAKYDLFLPEAKVKNSKYTYDKLFSDRLTNVIISRFRNHIVTLITLHIRGLEF